MAAIGSLQLETLADGQLCNTAVAIWLNDKPDISVLVKLPEINWEMEVKAGEAIAAARSSSIFPADSAGDVGLENIELGLDLISFREHSHLLMRRKDRTRLVLSTHNAHRKLLYESTIIQRLRLPRITITINDKDGNIRRSEKDQLKWVPALRYYRMSQTRDDAFDAYRHLFLAFEATLHTVCPITVKPKEHERDWMRRALRVISQKVDLAQFAPRGSSDPIDGIIESQYGEVRLRLFHSKLSSTSEPNEGIKEAAVEVAYGTLIMLCREILIQFGGLAGPRGAYSDRVLQASMEAIFKDIDPAFTSDNSPFVEGQPFSPLQLPIHHFADQQYTPSTTSNTAEFSARTPLTDSMIGDPVFKLGLLRNESWLIGETIDEGLCLHNVSELEWRAHVIMTQGSMPKTTFQVR